MNIVLNQLFSQNSVSDSASEKGLKNVGLIDTFVIGDTKIVSSINGDICKIDIIEQEEVKLHINSDVHTAAEDILDYFSNKNLKEYHHKIISVFCSILSF